jgi:hypothetical protein
MTFITFRSNCTPLDWREQKSAVGDINRLPSQVQGFSTHCCHNWFWANFHYHTPTRDTGIQQKPSPKPQRRYSMSNRSPPSPPPQKSNKVHVICTTYKSKTKVCHQVLEIEWSCICCAYLSIEHAFPLGLPDVRTPHEIRSGVLLDLKICPHVHLHVPHPLMFQNSVYLPFFCVTIGVCARMRTACVGARMRH